MPMEGASLPMNAQSAILPVRCSGKFGRIRARTRSARRYLYIGTEFLRMRYISMGAALALPSCPRIRARLARSALSRPDGLQRRGVILQAMVYDRPGRYLPGSPGGTRERAAKGAVAAWRGDSDGMSTSP